ncbi:hypothetical protein [Myxococcus eversor]|uniref:hypothetical protein n=1 Tax=Myxococcus eversor TaxID=2709661 RepID=UPI0013D6EC7D|nr:hypothetical protein [Myxococcus eversor]
MTACAQERCTIGDCTRTAAPGRRQCHAHQKRATRGQSLSTPVAETYATPWERLVAAALAYADAGDDEEEFARAKDRLRKAAQSYARSLLLQPPAPLAPRARKESGAGQLELWPESKG